MLHRLIDFFLDRPWLAIFMLLTLAALGLRALFGLPIDAFPDLTNNQVTVVTDAPAMAAVEVEQLVTFPIESAMMGLPDTLEVRSISKFGLSMITVVFEDRVPPLTARQLINERLLEARERIPAGIEPQLGYLATPFGEVFQYIVESGRHSPMELKTIHDWQIKYLLRAVPGVADVNTWGGLSRRIEIVADPDRLRGYGLTLRDVFERVRDNNTNFSGGFVEHSSEQYTVRGLGRAVKPADFGAIVLEASSGASILLRDVADVRTGAVPRQGAVTAGGVGETVSGMVIMLKGQNSKTVIERVKAAIEHMRGSLPEGVRLVPFYDQSEVIQGTIETVRNNLLEGAALVTAVLFLALGQVRAALMVALVIPFSMLFAFMGMGMFAISANLMSLGAVDFGVVIDGAVVMVDNCARRLEERAAEGGVLDRLAIVRAAAKEVAVPVASGVMVVTAVYIPVLSLESLEGRMFRPMAVTICAAVLGSLLLALFVLPTGCRYLLRTNVSEKRSSALLASQRAYRRVLERVAGRRALAAVAALLLFAGAAGSLAFIGTEFMPRLDEGAILLETIRLPSIGLTESVEQQLGVEQALLEFPEVTQVVSKLGRPDFATEAMGVYQADVYINLKPRSEWTTAKTKDGLIEAMEERLGREIGTVFGFTQPMAMRLDETVSGVRADVAIKIFGDDERILEDKADEILQWLAQVPGAADVRREFFSGAAEWRVEVDRGRLSRYGLNVTDVEETVEAAIHGRHVTDVIDGRVRFPVSLRLPESARENRHRLADTVLRAPGGEWVRLGEVAQVTQAEGPEVVQREDSQRRLVVQCNVRGRDTGSFVEEARQSIERNVSLPAGYFLRWGGQFEHQERAMKRLALVLPLVIGLIFFICYGAFGSAREALLVLMLVPFAAVGGIAALWLRGMPLNVSAAIGFITVFGIAVTDGLVLVSAIRRKIAEGLPMRQAQIEAGLLRLRPVVMTSVVAALGLLPMAVATSTGAEVQRPLATVVIGGVVSSTVLTLLLTPTLFPWFQGREGRRLVRENGRAEG